MPRTQRKDYLNGSKGPHYLCGPDHMTVHHEFGVGRDSKGRTIGANISTGTLELIEIPEDYQGWFYADKEPGTYYVLCVHATRGGESFGALQRERFFKTVAERDAAIAKYLKEAAKRAAKLVRS